jgi:hypothetical protein
MFDVMGQGAVAGRSNHPLGFVRAPDGWGNRRSCGRGKPWGSGQPRMKTEVFLVELFSRSPAMRSMCLMALVVSLVGDASAWPAEQNQNNPAPEKLTAESARDALVDMIAKDGPIIEDRKREIDALKSGKTFLVMEKNAEGIVSEVWNCDLATKRFWFHAHVGFSLYEYHGTFEYTKGRWIAKVTGKSRAYLGPRSLP